MSAPQFARFVSSVEGHMVTRYGTTQLIGCVRNAAPKPEDDAAEWKPVSWNTREIVPLTMREAERYTKEYDKAIRNGALKERKREEWSAQNDTTLKTEKAARDATSKASEKSKSDAPASTSNK